MARTGRGLGLANNAPFYTYITGLKYFNQLDQAPPVGATGNLPVPGTLPDLPMPPVLSNLNPNKPMKPQPAKDLPKYARGGAVGAWLTPQQRALLDAIAHGESAGKYNIMYRDRYFNSYADHPRAPARILRGPNAGKLSSAAGRYQFIEGTWDDYRKRLGLKDFSPENQDRAALQLAADRYGGMDRLNAALSKGDPRSIANVASRLRSTWTSLPGGIESTVGQKGFYERYTKALGRAPQVAPSQAAPSQVQMARASGAPQRITGVPVDASAASQAMQAQVARPVSPEVITPVETPTYSTGMETAAADMAAQQAAQAASAQAAAQAASSASAASAPAADPFGGLMDLISLTAMMQPAPPPPMAGGGARPPRQTDPNKETVKTSHTPDWYARRRRMIV